MPQEHSLKQIIKEFFQIALFSLAIILPVRYFLVQPFYVKGASMEPSFYDREYLLIDELSYRFREPLRGEVVVLRRGRGIADFIIKRIVGLPSEKVVIKNNQVLVYPAGSKEPQVLDESSYLDPEAYTFGEMEVTLGETEYFVLGDNRTASLDSRTIGPIPQKAIVGRTWIRGWPFDRFTRFAAPSY